GGGVTSSCTWQPRGVLKPPQRSNLGKLLGSFAHFLTLCRASNLAEAQRISSPEQGASPAKTRAASRPPRAHGPPLQPSTNCYKLSDVLQAVCGSWFKCWVWANLSNFHGAEMAEIFNQTGMPRKFLVHDHPCTFVPLKVATGSITCRKAPQSRAAAPRSPSVSLHRPACDRLSLVTAPPAQVPPRPQR